jgi:cytochrome c
MQMISRESNRAAPTARRALALTVATLAGLAMGRAGAADYEHGFALFQQHCAACHSHIASVWDKSGPNLNGLFGRRAGSADYIHGYSDAMKASNLTWDLGSLMAFITSPAGVVRGTNMVFRGLEDPADRADLLCYLRQATAPNRTGMPADCDDL